MKVIVFGANGRVGSVLVKQLIKQNYEVVAFIHGKNNLPKSKLVSLHKGNIYSPENVSLAMNGCDVVISALGSWGTPKKDILSSAMKNIIPAMEQQNIKRIITLTGSDALANQEKPTLIQQVTRPIFTLLAKNILEDGEKHISLLENSKLDWTTLRSPVMNNIGNPKNFCLKDKPPNPLRTINRQSVAIALANQITDTVFIHQAPYIYRK